MSEERIRAALAAVELPDAEAAQARASGVVRSAYVTREPIPRSRHRTRTVAAVALAGAVVLGLLSPPGRAFVDRVRKAVGVERDTAPALFALPARGRLLVASDAGVWIVRRDGSKRLLGTYREATWSPFGRFVAAARDNELAALEPDGTVRWTLSRPKVRLPRWSGTPTDTRIAYITGKRIHIVAGDGANDFESSQVPAAAVAPAWRPGSTFELAYVTAGGRLAVAAKWPALPTIGGVRKIEWSSDGRRLLAVREAGLRVFDDRAQVVARDDPSEGTLDLDATFIPGTHRVVALRFDGATTTLFEVGDDGRVLFTAAGRLTQVVAAPDGSGVLLAWPAADQWVFVRLGGSRGVRAIANVSEQFRSRSFPRIEGWVGSNDAGAG